jgi:AraC family ethanolamine operon transcriptional activator
MRTFGMIAQTSPQIEWRRSAGTPRHIVVFPVDDEFEFISHPGFGGDTISMPEERFLQVARSLDLLGPLGALPIDQALIESDPARIEVFRKRLNQLCALGEISGDRLVRRSIVADAEFGAIAALVEALSAGRGVDAGRPGPSTRSRAIRNAIDYIEDHASEPPSIEEICHASGVSWRTLNYAFRERFDLTPKQYLRAVRLNGFRRELVSRGPEIAISEVAADWGFWHMGQFAADYRRQFSELPSETARRARI